MLQILPPSAERTSFSTQSTAVPGRRNNHLARAEIWCECPVSTPPTVSRVANGSFGSRTSLFRAEGGKV